MKSLSHVAIIMDGNGRWAKKKNKPRKFGHLEGSKIIKPLVKFCIKKKILNLTLFAFGLDNWNRPKGEINYIFYLLKKFLVSHKDFLIKNDIKVKFIGEINFLTKDIKKLLKSTEILTKKNKKIVLTIALNYSSKHEILNSINNSLLIKKKKITINDLEKNLYTSYMKDPEILIRTGGYKRLSNFLLWQNSYSEFFFIKKLWPDFTISDLNKIVKKYFLIKRNFGAL